MLALSVAATGCSSRLSHDDIVRASGAQQAAGEAAAGSASSSSGVGPVNSSGPGATAGGGVATSPGAGDRPATTIVSPGGAGTAGTTGGAHNSTAVASGAPIVIGSAGSYTGLGTAGLDQARNALQAWVADTNAHGGIKGHPLRLVVKDDGGDASKGRAQVQELVEKDKAIALVANLGYSSSADAWQGYLEQKKVPAIGGNCAAKGWTSSPVFFSQCPAPDTMFYGAVVLGARYGTGKKFGAMVCTEDSVCSTGEGDWFSKGYARKAGLQPVYQAEISLAQPDFTAQCLQAKSAGVQILGLVVDPATTKRIIASCSQQGFKPEYLLTYAEEAPDTPKYASDIISAQTQFPFMGLDTAEYQAFTSVWHRYYQADPTPMAATAWASAKILEKALRGGKQMTSAGLIETLYRYHHEQFDGLTIPLSYGPHGTTNTPCIFYMRGSGGRWTAPLSDKPVCW
jgi:branched-chain amino acid transport system substrate-binding protein